ncbi:MAG: GNAT family N-acetyltransferase [Streptococcaceae bacterium]|jgi:phosphinothricin acetyltransferase|nr:GNAT family N-acetyltransferase [Streptococcaceae bacterium]
MRFRLAKVADAATLLAIYAPYIEKTAITFEYELPSVAEFGQRIEKTLEDFPYLVAADNSGKILGYAYAGRYRERKAYDWVVELSVYVAEEAQSQGVGKALYQRLFALLKKQNYQRAYACITSPNPSSIAFHEAFGFHLIGLMEKSGYKFDKWWGITWMDLALQDSDEVKPIKKLSALTNTEINEVLYS